MKTLWRWGIIPGKMTGWELDRVGKSQRGKVQGVKHRGKNAGGGGGAETHTVYYFCYVQVQW